MPFFGLVQPKCDHCGYRCGEMFHQGWRHSDYPGFVFGRKKCLVEYVRAHPKEIAILNLNTNMKSKTETEYIPIRTLKLKCSIYPVVLKSCMRIVTNTLIHT